MHFTKQQRKEILQYFREITPSTVWLYRQDQSITAQIAAKLFDRSTLNKARAYRTELIARNRYLTSRLQYILNNYILVYDVTEKISQGQTYYQPTILDLRSLVVAELGRKFLGRDFEVEIDLTKKYRIYRGKIKSTTSFKYSGAVKFFNGSGLKFYFVVFSQR